MFIFSSACAHANQIAEYCYLCGYGKGISAMPKVSCIFPESFFVAIDREGADATTVESGRGQKKKLD
jgi:hypothetical protein